MSYKDGPWGEKAKERSKRRSKYFVEYKRKQRLKVKSTFVPKGCPKRNARQKVRDHILSGKIKKPEKCEHCKLNNKLEAHHKDYSKPLEVEWVCKSCHVKADKLLKNKIDLCQN